jgi:histidine triad (HIT) family protein
MNARCVFCRIIAGEETVSIVYEDDRTVAFMDIQPASPGHVLVVSRDHHADIFDIPQGLASHCLEVAKQLAPGIRTATGAAALNLFSANGRAGGQDVEHFHLHLIPVREGEVFDLQLPKEGVPIPSRSQLDVMAARIGRAVQKSGALAGRRRGGEAVPASPASSPASSP